MVIPGVRVMLFSPVRCCIRDYDAKSQLACVYYTCRDNDRVYHVALFSGQLSTLGG